MSDSKGWKLIEDDGSYVRLCRKDPGTNSLWECAAILIGVRNGDPDVWLKTPAPHLVRYSPDRGLNIIREVPDEEAIAIILRAIEKAPF